MTIPQAVESGTVDAVYQAALGSELAADAATGATVVTVVDTSDFDSEQGGTLSINGVQYGYTAVDDDSGEITLATGLTADAATEDRVDLWDTALDAPAVEYRALVSLPGDIDDADQIDAVVLHALIPLLPEGIRAPGEGETVVIAEQAGEWAVTDVRGKQPQLDGALIALASIPQVALGFTLPDGAQVTVADTAPASPAVGDVWIDSADGNTFKQWDGSTWGPVQWGTGALADGAVDASKVSLTAREIGGISTTIATTAPSSPTVGDQWFDSDNDFQLARWDGSSWVAVQFGTAAIAAGSITAALIAAHAITAAQIQAGTITATEIQAGTITSGLIAANAVLAGNIAAGAIDASKIAAGTVVAGIVDATTITGAEFVSHGLFGNMLVYQSTPALGNMLCSISGSNFTDSFGNEVVGDGFTCYLGAEIAFYAGQAALGLAPDNAVGAGGMGNTTGPLEVTAQTDLTLEGRTGKVLINGATGVEITGDATVDDDLTVTGATTANGGLTVAGTTKIGAGPSGKCYKVNATFSFTLPTNAYTVVPAITKTKEHTDYANPWSGATFTAPVSGYYSATLAANNVINASRSAVIINKNGTGAAGTACPPTTGFAGGPVPLSTAVTGIWLDAGDTLTFTVRQDSGSSITATGTITVARDL